MVRVCCGSDDADIERQGAAAGLTADGMRAAGILVCRPSQLIDRLGQWRSAGVDRVVLSGRSAVDLPTVELIGTEVLGHF